MKGIYLLVFALFFALSLFAQQDQSSTTPATPTPVTPATSLVDSSSPPPAAESANPSPSGAVAAAEPTRTPIAPATARLHVYRQRRFVGSALAPSITVDGTKVARVGSGRHCTIKLTPGSHTIGSDDKSSAIAVEAKAGQEYYVRVDEETGFWKGHGRLTLVMPEQGAAEFKLQKFVEPDRRFAKDMIEEEADTAPDKK